MGKQGQAMNGQHRQEGPGRERTAGLRPSLGMLHRAGQVAALLVLCLGFSTILYAAKQYPLTASSIVPAARGQMEFSEDKNGNNKIKIKVEHLAAPENLTPPRNSYVIWFKKREDNPVIEGVLKVDKDLKAEFETTTPWKNFAVVITAEDEPSPKSPGGPEVLRATVQR